MKANFYIRIFIVVLSGISFKISYSQNDALHLRFDFCGDTLNIKTDNSVIAGFTEPLSEQSIENFYNTINAGNYKPIIDSLSSYKEKHKLNDWLYYQLIRKTAQQIAPKADNYQRYTLYKWFFLCKSGYDATLGIGSNELLFYVRSEDSIYDIPFYMRNGRQYVCLNIHDYGKMDFAKETVYEIKIHIPEAQKAFSYRVTQMPDFKPGEYAEKDLQFNYHDSVYHFNVMLNPQVQAIFKNYPVVDFETYFNIPLSSETYHSLIPILKKNVESMSVKKGVDYLMCFTRYAFLYENDQENFGKEKRLCPEETLLYEYSDCDDRAALFFYLIKEIYNLPMIALLYPTHITVAVKFDKPVGNSVVYNGNKYSVCEPTAQVEELRLGQIATNLRHSAYQVVYAYDPQKK